MNKKEPRADGHIDVENHGAVLVARIDGGPHALFDAALTKQLKELVNRADRDPNIHAIGTQQSLVTILEGKPHTPAEALALGAIDEVV